MTMTPASHEAELRLDRRFVERERNRFAGRALSFLVLLNGGAAFVLLAILGQAAPSSVDSKIASALMFFSGGAVAALLSSFLAYVNRTVRMEAPERASLRRALRLLAIVAVLGSGAAFLTGMNMVGSGAAAKSSSHPKGPKQPKAPVSAPSQRVHLPTEIFWSPAARLPRQGLGLPATLKAVRLSDA
jgi:hypothetical protein